MQLKDILVHLDRSDRLGARLDLAIDLANRHDAHLTGIHVLDISPGSLAAQVSGMGDAGAMAVMLQRLMDEARQAAVPLEAQFVDRLRAEGKEGEWRLLEGSESDNVIDSARYADLTIVGQPNPEDRDGAATALIEQLLFDSGRPVLLVPYAGTFRTTGHNVLVGWNGSREAARAVGDAMPFLAEAKSVTVLSVTPGRGDGEEERVAAADLTLHLARHGITAVAAHTTADSISEGDALLNYASDSGCDLLVMGGYGHSRLREIVMGGVTRSLLRHMTIPILMSH